MLRTRTGLHLPDYDAVWEYSTQDLAGFWSAVADHYDVCWHSRPSSVIDDTTMPGTNWFPGGTLNYAEHALRPRPSDDAGHHPAVLAIAEDGGESTLTLQQLSGMVGAAQAGLRRLGVRPGDRVVALVPNAIHALIGFLATAAIGAVWSSCSPTSDPDPCSTGSAKCSRPC